MKKTYILIIIMLATGLICQAQTLQQVGKAKKVTKNMMQPSNGFTGYFNITDIGVLIGSTDNSRVAPFSFLTINGVHLTEQFSVGLGLGLEFPTGSYMPIVIDTRYYLRDEAFSPFFSIYTGYAVPLDDNGYYNGYYDYSSSSIPYQDYSNYTATGGWLINPGFGFRYMSGENFGLIFGVGYRFQRLHYQGEGDREVYSDLNRLSLKFGITFK